MSTNPAKVRMEFRFLLLVVWEEGLSADSILRTSLQISWAENRAISLLEEHHPKITAKGIMPEISIAMHGTHDVDIVTSTGIHKCKGYTDTSKSADDFQMTIITTYDGAYALIGEKPRTLPIDNVNKASYKYGPGLIDRSLDRLVDIKVRGLGVQKTRVLIVAETEYANEDFIQDFVREGNRYWISRRGYEPLVDGAEAILSKGMARLADLFHRPLTQKTSTALVVRNTGHKSTDSRYPDRTFRASNDAKPKDLRPKQPYVSRLPPKGTTSFKHGHANGDDKNSTPKQALGPKDSFARGSSTRELRREDYRRSDAHAGSDSDRSRGSRGGRANANRRHKNKEAKLQSTRSIGKNAERGAGGGPHSKSVEDGYQSSYQSYQWDMATSDYPPVNPNYNYDNDSWRNNQRVSDAYQRGCEKAEISLESRLNPLAVPFTGSPQYSPSLSNVSFHSSFDRYSPWPAHKPLELGWSVPEPYGGYTNQQFTFVGADEISPPRALRCDATDGNAEAGPSEVRYPLPPLSNGSEASSSMYLLPSGSEWPGYHQAVSNSLSNHARIDDSPTPTRVGSPAFQALIADMTATIEGLAGD
ncbi:hypothetical protein P7C70_g8351, partial [Phenoliferia sp. Uapishka_3]